MNALASTSEMFFCWSFVTSPFKVPKWMMYFSTAAMISSRKLRPGRVLALQGDEVAVQHQVVAHENTEASDDLDAEALVVGSAEAHAGARTSNAVHVEVKSAEQTAAIGADSELLLSDDDAAHLEALFNGLDQFNVGNRKEGFGGGGCRESR
jgi:hypothetical protein